MTGRVIGVEGGVYTLMLEDGRQVEASLRGRLKQESRGGSKIVIGDCVKAEEADGAATVQARLPRQTTMVRRGVAGRSAKVLAANLDRVFVVMVLLPIGLLLVDSQVSCV